MSTKELKKRGFKFFKLLVLLSFLFSFMKSKQMAGNRLLLKPLGVADIFWECSNMLAPWIGFLISQFATNLIIKYSKLEGLNLAGIVEHHNT